MTLPVHVYPTLDLLGETEHVTSGETCWCDPRRCVLCPECGDFDGPNPDCWRCGGNLVDAQPGDAPHILVHNDVPKGVT